MGDSNVHEIIDTKDKREKERLHNIWKKTYGMTNEDLKSLLELLQTFFGESKDRK
jgi:uncharacterized tellurite resistance protein B-like protein